MVCTVSRSAGRNSTLFRAGEVCYEPRDYGFCKGSVLRWYFDSETSKCRSFSFGGCGGNLNNFEAELECRTACPVLTSCQTTRAKNLLKKEKVNRVSEAWLVE